MATNYRDTLAYKLLFDTGMLPDDLFPNFDRIGGNGEYSSPRNTGSKQCVSDFVSCFEAPSEIYRLYGKSAFGTREAIMALDSELSLGSKDPMHEVISEEDTSVVTNTHYLRLAHKLFDFYNLPGNLTQGRATWEATLMPVGRTYFDPEKQAHVQVTIRPDIVYGVKLPGTDLDFGQGEPGQTSRAFAVMEFKRKGMLSGLVTDLRRNRSTL